MYKAIAILIISFGLAFNICTGCVKQPSSEIDYGPEVRKSEVASALKSAIGQASPFDIKLNEFSLTDTTRVIRGRNIIDLLESVGMTVVRREETGTQLQLNLVEERVEYDLSGAQNHKKILREHIECLNKLSLQPETCEEVKSKVLEAGPDNEVDVIGTPVLLGTNDKTDAPSLNWTERMVEKSLKLSAEFLPNKASSQDETRVTYHALKVTDRVGTPPKSVQTSANCGGIPNCQINIRDVEYDQVNWLNYKKGEKIHVRISTSQEVPYLSRVLDKCQQGSVAIKQEGKPEKDWPRLLVTFCETVRNFQKGE